MTLVPLGPAFATDVDADPLVVKVKLGTVYEMPVVFAATNRVDDEDEFVATGKRVVYVSTSVFVYVCVTTIVCTACEVPVPIV
jgi:hypothetical protein